MADLSPERVVVTEPGEWRLMQDFRRWPALLAVPVDILPDDRFLCTHEAFALWAEGRKALRMEYFYRDMRRQTGLLMDGDQPVGGKWNYDNENRKPADSDLFMPTPRTTAPDAITTEVLALVATRFGDHFGDLEPFWFAVTREDAEAALAAFIDQALPRFGDYQDAMLTGEPFLYHAVISQYLNCGLLASKPYAASGAYINRMSDHCGSCRFDVKQRTGPQACPFNALYWNFIAHHRDRIAGNPRMAQMVRTYDRFDPAEQQRIAGSARGFLEEL